MTDLRVVVVDDESDVRLLLRLQLPMHGIEVVGEASNGREALELVREVQPEAVVLDLLMPEMNGFELIPLLQAEFPGLHIVAYSAVAGDFVRSEMNRLGVALRLKSGDPEPLVGAIRSLCAAGGSGANQA